MHEYDVIVVGAGPAGCSAARAATEQGAKTILIEEHPVIGLPRHCAGRLDIPSFAQEFLRNNVLSSIDSRVILSELKYHRFFSPSGQIVREVSYPPGCAYGVVREEFDRELARRAADAGAQVMLNTRVTGLLKEHGKVIGVTTTSKTVRNAYGQIVIAAQGNRGRRSGIPAQESLSYPEEASIAGILVEFEGISDLEPGVLEMYTGYLAGKGYIFIGPLSSKSGMVAVSSLETLDKILKEDSLVSRKLRGAVPIQMFGYSSGSRSGQVLPKLVKDGLMLVGDSAGYSFIVNAIFSGRFAGEVAAEAIRQGDVSEVKLREYERKCQREGLPFVLAGLHNLRQLAGRSDNDIEAVLPQIVNKIDYHAVYSV